jgi:hypothetical protein
MESGVTDYLTMSGAEFRHEVGTDPERWAEAMLQRDEAQEFWLGKTREDRLRWLTEWFADAMQAARVDEQHNRIA